MARLECIEVEKTYPGGIAAVRGITLDVEDGELFVIVGPSGSGKSTLLRLIAGLETPDAGHLKLDGRSIENLAPRDRDLAMVFQDQVLYPHLDVFENIAFGLRARRVARSEINERVQATSAILGLADCLRRRPGTLSGGQRRRVALGRALVVRPRLFLLDEPFSGLDAPLRAATRAELVDLHRKLGSTMILVTHDQAEALAIGDRVAVLDQGKLAQVARPIELYDRPAHRSVARFVGLPTINLIPGQIFRSEAGPCVRINESNFWPIPGDPTWASRSIDRGVTDVELGLRPEHIRITPNGPATIHRLEPMGHETLAFLSLGLLKLVTRLPADQPFQPGDRAEVTFDLARASWFDPVTGDRL